MELKLFSGETRLTTIYNVIKICSECNGVLSVKNKLDGVIQINKYLFNKDYNRFTIELD